MATSEDPTLPCAPIITLAPNVHLQPPLSRRGTGPGLILFVPAIAFAEGAKKPLDPEPMMKWAEEGFAVVAVVTSADLDIEGSLKLAVDALRGLDVVDIKDKFGVIVYDTQHIYTISDILSHSSSYPHIVAFTAYGSFPSPALTLPILLHLTSTAPRPRNAPSALTTTHTYRTPSPHFVLPPSPAYDPASAALAHSRTLVFLRKHIGGPVFDLEAVWDEHTYFEFVERSVEKTMATMVAEPYVNHVPTMTGGIGRENLTAFYRDHFIFSNPEDAELQVVSRTVGADRVVDEFIYTLTHTRTVDWLLPGVPPTHRKLAIPMIAVVNIRGDRLYNEHIWWDQATALRQAGVLPSHLPFVPSSPSPSPSLADPTAPTPAPTPASEPLLLRLPVAGAECAEKLRDEMAGRSNEMFGADWGVQGQSQAQGGVQGQV